MSQDAARASLLDQLVAAADGDESLRALYASSSLDEIVAATDALRDAGRRGRRGRLAAVWSDGGLEIEEPSQDRPAAA